LSVASSWLSLSAKRLTNGACVPSWTIRPHATAVAGLRHCGLRAVRVEDHTAVIRMVIDRYDDLVALQRMSRAKNVPALSRAERVRVRGPR
jgi:hypothetical protein